MNKRLKKKYSTKKMLVQLLNEVSALKGMEEPDEVNIKIRYLVDGIQELDYIAGKSDWIDLRSAKDIELKKHQLTLIPLGVAMELPKGYEAILAPRSGAPKNFKIMQANSIGIIDESYCGDTDEWGLMVYPIEDSVIHKNDRLCQFRIVRHQPKIKFIKVESLGNKARSGFGSTGRA